VTFGEKGGRNPQHGRERKREKKEMFMSRRKKRDPPPRCRKEKNGTKKEAGERKGKKELVT